MNDNEERLGRLRQVVQVLSDRQELFAIISSSESKDVAVDGLCAEFGISAAVANQVLDLRLEQLFPTYMEDLQREIKGFQA